uniref:Uncharacterized protein n=1 Tax=Panthera tigris altaica TaxID=74533 RepID=A0A8C9J583_PANTA
MGQDRVDAWPSPQSFFPSPERKRENGVALCPEWPQPALWACALGKGLVTWPLWSRHFVSPILSPQPQSSISPSHCGHGLEGPRYLLPPPWYTGALLNSYHPLSLPSHPPSTLSLFSVFKSLLWLGSLPL